MQVFTALQQASENADYSRRARKRAAAMQDEMDTAKPTGQLGNGELADLRDAGAAGLLDNKGLFLGAMDGRLLFFNGEGPLLTYLRTGFGKGRDLVLPNAAHVRDMSLVFNDLKDGENAFASADHRQKSLGIPCIFLDPYGVSGRKSTAINPLQVLKEIVRRGAQVDSEAREIAQTLLPLSPKEPGDQWVKLGSRRLLALFMEHAAHFDQDACTLGGLWRFVNSGQADSDDAFAMMATCDIDSIARRADAFRDVRSNAPKQFEAYRSDAVDSLDAFEPGKALEIATSAHEFDFARLKHRPHTVYLILPSDKIEVAAPWVSLIINYAIETIARERGPIRTTFLLDEFPQLPPAPAVMKALRLYRGKGVQLWFFAQGRHSMEGKWSRDAVKEIEDQAAVMTVKNVLEPDLIRDIELWSGNRSVLMRGVSHNGGQIEAANTNLGEQKRPVLQSEDIVGMTTKQIIRVAGAPRLIVADTVPFFDVKPWNEQIGDVRTLHTGAV
jgi:type IV secretion system protein VirD4